MSAKATFKKLIQHSLAAAVLVASQGGNAHTTTLLEMKGGDGFDNAIAMGHGCEAENRGIIAQSVVFPTVNPIITETVGHHDEGGAAPEPLAMTLDEIIEGGTLEGFAALIQSRDIFLNQKPKTNALGNSIGFYGTLGLLSPELKGRVPFQANAPRFVDTSCVKTLTVEYAVADICLTSKPTIKPNKVNLWIPNNGSQFAIKGSAQGVDGVGHAATLIIHRDEVNNPLPTDGSCATEHDSLTVTISPEDVDANLPIPGWTH